MYAMDVDTPPSRYFLPSTSIIFDITGMDADASTPATISLHSSLSKYVLSPVITSVATASYFCDLSLKASQSKGSYLFEISPNKKSKLNICLDVNIFLKLIYLLSCRYLRFILFDLPLCFET